MQLKQEFIRTCNKLGLEDCEAALAEVIWQRAERAAWGLSKQVPSLLDNKEQQYKQTVKLEIDMIESEIDMNNLTQADVQVLTKLISQQIHELQRCINYDKVTIQALWKVCDPDDHESKEAFDELNFYKQRTTTDKKERDKLAAVQYKLKKLQSFLGN